MFNEYLSNIKKIAQEEGFDSLDETYISHLKARYFGETVVIGQGRRVLLRELMMSDLNDIYAFPDAKEEEALRDFVKDTFAESQECMAAYISGMYPMYDYGIWAVEIKETGELAGLCGLGQREVFGEMFTDLGYYICPKWRKKGIATECIEIVLDYVKNYLEFRYIYAIIKEENRISKGLLRKFGFECVEQSEGSRIFRKELKE